MTDPEAFDPAPEASGSSTPAVIRLLGLLVVFLVLPMLLIAAMAHPEGCGGG